MRWIDDLINLLFPAECHLCGHSLGPHERFICLPCIETLPRTGYHRHHRNPMEEKFAGHFPFVDATGHFFYSKDSSLAQLIQDMKYRNFPSIGNKMGEIAGKELYTAGFLSDVDLIVPVPMHFWKQAKRGYNQTERIAQGISDSTGIPVVNALKMIHQRKTQTSLSRAQRLANAEGLFVSRGNIDLNGKTILLVDDICTTGATMGGAAKALADAFPGIRQKLFSLAVAF
ncbi:MAG: ComF family protein [Muribaculaceae bacterium]|nr:ComF family protein [Muribaculaceae bacterium]